MPDITARSDSTAYERFRWNGDLAIFGRQAVVRFASDEQERLIRNLLDNWHLREIAWVRQMAMPDIVAEYPDYVASLETSAWRELEERTRNRLTVSRTLSWWYTDNPILEPSERGDIGMIPVRSDLRTTARELATAHPWYTFIVQAQATVLPVLPDVPSSAPTDRIDLPDSVSRLTPPTESELARQRARLDNLDTGTINMAGSLCDSIRRTSGDSCSPDASQPYPLDDLLDRIDDVTSERG
jgi:hypothetical protein